MTVVSNYTALLYANSWSGLNATNAPAFVTYSFSTVAQAYLGNAYSPAAISSFQAFDENDKALARDALRQWADVSGLVFLEVADGAGDINFSKLDFNLVPGYEHAWGFAGHPSRELTATYAYDLPRGGDVFIHSQLGNATSLMLHEIGHALGFKHPFDGDPTLETSLDTQSNTVLSYTGARSSVLQAFDIQAVQHVYGNAASDGTHLASWSWNAATSVLTQVGKATADKIYGTRQRDIVDGANGNDTVGGFFGNDDLAGGGGDDRLFGGEGNNRLDGGTGNDGLYAENGDDTLDGGAGNDGLSAGLGNDRLKGGTGNDNLNGGDGNDVLDGGAGDDVLDGAFGNDTADYGLATASVDIGLDWRWNGSVSYHGTGAEIGIDVLYDIENVTGGGGADLIRGSSVANVLRGGAGGDLLEGLGGNDVLEGGSGNDTLDGGADSDVLDGGTGVDTADYGDIAGAVWVTLAGASNASVKVNGVAEDTLRNIENVTGAWTADTLTGDGLANRLDGAGGNDILDGAAGNDIVDGGSGDDSLTGGAGNDVVQGNSGNDIGEGGTGDDTVDGGAGNDVLRGGTGTDVLDGGADIDTADYADKVIAVSVILAATSNASVTVGGAVEDTLRNIENVIGGSAADALTGDSLANRLEGAAGNDTLDGGAGNDLLDGGAGRDVLDGGVGLDTADYGRMAVAVAVTLAASSNASVKLAGIAEDTLRNVENVNGGSAADRLAGDGLANRLEGGAGNDVLAGGAGNDVLDGGADVDTADYAGTAGTVWVTLAEASNAAVTVAGIVEDQLRNIENVTGGSAADRLAGDSLANWLKGAAGGDTLHGGAGNDLLDGGTANDVLDGGTGNDLLEGSSGNDVLDGGIGDDVLDGGTGKDTLDGGADVDTADYSDKAAAVSVILTAAVNATMKVDGVAEDTLRNIENVTGGSAGDVLTGDGLSNRLEGGAGNDRLKGAGGNDLLKGGADRDVLDGGSGADTADYSDKASAVAVTLAAAADASVKVGGVAEDTLRNIENVTGGSAGDALTGDGLSNRLEGGAGNDRLVGAGGNDLLKGGADKDVLDGGAGLDTADYSDKTSAVAVALAGASNVSVTVGGVAEDTLRNIENVVGGSAADALTGDSLANRLDGAAGNDALNGGAGNDLVEGGTGNDVLNGGAGNDVLDGGADVDMADYGDRTAAVSVTLAGASNASLKIGTVAEDILRNIENVTGGSAADDVTGDGFANALFGGAGNDRLHGAGGDDLLKGGAGEDVLKGGTGFDTVDYSDQAGAVSVTLAGAANAAVKIGGISEDTIRDIENVMGGSAADRLTGDSLANRLEGAAGDDVLAGGAGNDILDGGAGLDTADYSGIASAVAVTLAGASNASVRVGFLWEDTLRNIENVTGGSEWDALGGDDLANRLDGQAGDDVLNGGAGNDRLTGGAGSDTFVFNTTLGASNIDRIVDFDVSLDSIHLDRSIFTDLTLGTLAAGAFFVGVTAQDASDRVVYNALNGALIYDSNGSAAGGATRFAQLGTGLALTFSDFFIG